jgi:hypothetical protein
VERPTDIKAPTPATLAKYGLTADEWWAIMERQGYRCPIMNQPSGTGRYVIDHEHVRGWKKMPPEQRKQHVRGIVSWFANHAYLGRGISVERALRVALFLAKYEGAVGLVYALERMLGDIEEEGLH